MKLVEVKQRLYGLGYLKTKRSPLAPAVKAFQRDQGLRADGRVGRQTERALLDPLLGFCGVREHITTNSGMCKWPESAFPLRWTIAGSLRPRISDSDFKDAAALAWGYWMRVCGVRLEYTSNAKTANILMGVGRIDGASGTLAWSKLPCGNARQLDQLYDSGEPFVIDETPSRSQIDLVRVIAHEGGHMLGCPHLGGGALMQPMYSPSIRQPQAEDIQQMQRRYGKPVEQPKPTPAPDSKWRESDWMPIPFTDIEIKTRSPVREKLRNATTRR